MKSLLVLAFLLLGCVVAYDSFVLPYGLGVDDGCNACQGLDM